MKYLPFQVPSGCLVWSGTWAHGPQPHPMQHGTGDGRRQPQNLRFFWKKSEKKKWTQNVKKRVIWRSWLHHPALRSFQQYEQMRTSIDLFARVPRWPRAQSLASNEHVTRCVGGKESWRVLQRTSCRCLQTRPRRSMGTSCNRKMARIWGKHSNLLVKGWFWNYTGDRWKHRILIICIYFGCIRNFAWCAHLTDPFHPPISSLPFAGCCLSVQPRRNELLDPTLRQRSVQLLVLRSHGPARHNVAFRRKSGGGLAIILTFFCAFETHWLRRSGGCQASVYSWLVPIDAFTGRSDHAAFLALRKEVTKCVSHFFKYIHLRCETVYLL